MRRRSRHHQQPIRLGGARARAAGIAEVVSLSSLGGAEPFSAPLPETMALAQVLAVLKLDPDARRLLQANEIDGIPRRKLARYLGWDPGRVDAVRTRLQQRLAAFRETFNRKDFVLRGNTSTHLSYQESLPSGRRCWALTELGPGFTEILAAERIWLSGEARQTRPITSPPETLFAVA